MSAEAFREHGQEMAEIPGLEGRETRKQELGPEGQQTHFGGVVGVPGHD